MFISNEDTYKSSRKDVVKVIHQNKIIKFVQFEILITQYTHVKSIALLAKTYPTLLSFNCVKILLSAMVSWHNTNTSNKTP